MKRVLHIWQAEYPWEVRVGKLNRALQAAGAEVMVLARRKNGQPVASREDGVEIRRVGFDSGKLRALSLPLPGNPVWARAIRAAIAEFMPDLIIVRDIPLCPMAARIGRESGIRVVLDMAEHYPEAMRSWKKYSENLILRKIVHDWKVPDRVERSAMALVDGVLVVCQEQKDRLVREYGFAEEKICVVLNTPEFALQKNAPAHVERHEPLCFGYHGILCEDRALEFVLQGFEIAAKQAPELRLLIAGGGESEASLRKIAGGLASTHAIRFTGRYRPEELAALYGETDFGIVSLRANAFTEHTLANKFFDYAALGKPFIYTSLKPLENVMARMNCGVSFKPESAEAVAQAMLDIRDRRYDELAKNGINAVAREFNWQQDCNRMLSFLSGKAGVDLAEAHAPGRA